MKPIKMLGLAALAALMAMAFVGASSAMAESTSLCKTEESPCTGSNIITHVHEVTASGAKAKILPLDKSTIECAVLFLGDTRTSGLGNPLYIDGSFTYTNCTFFCSITEQNGPASLAVLKTGSELAEVAYSFLIHVNCFGIVVCTYVGTGLEGHGLGALTSTPNGAVSLSGQELVVDPETSDPECPDDAFLDITTKPLIATYIRT
jgi:hypothetical protein